MWSTHTLFSFGTKIKTSVKKWRAKAENCVDLYLSRLEQIGCWSKEGGYAARRTGVSYWMPRYSFLVVIFVTFVLSPISVFMFWNEELMMLMDSIVSIFVTSLIFLHMHFLYKGDRLLTVVAALKAMNNFGDIRRELPASAWKEVMFLSEVTSLYCSLVAQLVLPSFVAIAPIYYYVNRGFVFRYWYPFNSRVFPWLPLTTFVLTSGIAFGIYAMVVVNSLLMAFLVEAIGHFKLLRQNLESLGRLGGIKCPAKGKLITTRQPRRPFDVGAVNARRKTRILERKIGLQPLNSQENETVLESGSDESEASVKKMILHHQSILSYVEEITAAFDLILFHQSNCAIFPIILGLYITIHAPHMDIKIAIFCALMLFCVFDQAMFSWLAERVTEESSLVRDAAFGCAWLDASDGVKRSLRIVMTRSNKPVVVRVMGFLTLSNETLLSIMKLVYTYYMAMLKSIRGRG